jgi:hypothetical protein
LASLTKAHTETPFAALLRGRQGGWLSPNDCRIGEPYESRDW